MVTALLILATAANSLVAKSVVDGPPSLIPRSFNDDASLFLFNLFGMTAMTFLSVMMAGKQARRIWVQRHFNHPKDPVTIYRAILFFAGMGLFLRCGAEAMNLWGWNPNDPVTTARVLMAKRWIDPIALCCGIIWMTLAILGEPGVEHQLRKVPLPVDMWSRWPALMRAVAVVVLSFAAALAAVCLR
ncbi:hypothetical protein [uncultured Novosphingobium sp.]|uniref:hypothetical protein n=1 Tax=uncultured Novosphingobium sp. TaxID=292277 RepID=UPI00258EA61F|nr:hypothetical protein [uncultured Novosphingobium sp.]